jgi:hypothetical protein
MIKRNGVSTVKLEMGQEDVCTEVIVQDGAPNLKICKKKHQIGFAYIKEDAMVRFK